MLSITITIDTRHTRFILSLLLFLICLNTYSQVAEWNPQVATGKTNGVFNNLTDNSWFIAANWNFTSGSTASGVPDINTTVIIKDGTAPCYIPLQQTSPDILPRALSITIENNAGLYNTAGKNLTANTRFLEIAGDFTINSGGTYLGDTDEIRVNGNFLNNGDFILKFGTLLKIGGNYTNNSRISKETAFIGKLLTVDFNGSTDQVITHNNAFDNTYTIFTTFNTSPGTNAFTDQNLLVSNAVDELNVNKTAGKLSGNTAPSTPIFVGVVNVSGLLEVVSSGNLTLVSGTLEGNSVGAGISIEGNLTQSSGTINLLNSNLKVGGNWTSSGGSLTYGGTGIVIFEPDNIFTKQIAATAYNFEAVTFNDAGLGNIAEYNLTSNITVDGNLIIDKDCELNIPDGITANLSTTNIKLGGILDVEAGGTLAMKVNTTLTVENGGKIELVGEADKYILLTRQGSTGQYDFDVAGTIVARYFLIEHTNDNGVDLQATARSLSPGLITIGGGGSGYVSGSTQVQLIGGGGLGATATPTISSGTITSIAVNTPGSGYVLPPKVIISDPGGGTGAEAKALLTPTTLDRIIVTDGGSGYTVPPTVTITGGGGTGAAATAIVNTGRVIEIVVTNGGSGFTQEPIITITGVGAGANAIGYLTPGTVSSVTLTTQQIYPVATFSDGIFTNISPTGTAITIAEDYNTYRDGVNAYSTTETLPASVTHNYVTNPRIDTIYNCFFPNTPSTGTPKNVTRTGTTSNPTIPQNRIIFKDARGSFAGENYDTEDAVTVAAGTPNTALNPDGIANSDSMVVWREPHIKRWDGGPTATGTAWSDPQNWYPDGVPNGNDHVILDYSKVNLNFANITGPPSLVAPSGNLNIIMDLDPVTRPISCRSLTIETLLPSPNTSSTRLAVNLQLVQPLTVVEDLEIATVGQLNVNLSTAKITVGGNWTNNGTFVHGGSTVEFNQPWSRLITPTTGIVESYSLPASDANTAAVGQVDNEAQSFHNLVLSEGTSELGGYMRVENDFTIRNSTTQFNPSNNNFSMEIWGNWLNEGIFNPKAGKVIFSSTSSQTVGKGFRSAATATATVGGGSLSGFVVTSPGDKYAAAPIVVLDGGGGTGASATATIDGNGQVTGINIVTGGTGYSTAPTVRLVPIAKEDFYNVDVFKLLNHVTLLTRTEIANSLDFRNNNIIADSLTECIVGGNVTATSGYVDGPMGRIYSSTASTTNVYRVGKGTQISGNVSLELALNSIPASGDAGKALYIVERMNTWPTPGRVPAVTTTMNYFVNAHYRVYQSPYPLPNSAYPVNNVAGNLDLSSGKIGIPFNISNDQITNDGTSLISVNAIPLADLNDFTILADPGDATPVNTTDPLKGLDLEAPYHTPGANWIELARSASVNGNIESAAMIGLSTSFNQLGSGTFAVGVSYNAGKLNQTITFNSLINKTYGDANFTLNATASSGLTPTYISSNTSVATISGNTVTITGTGNTTIIASQAGNATYNAATSVTQLLVVNKADQTISFVLPNDVRDLNDGNLTLSATGGGSGNSVTFASSNSSVAVVSNNLLQIVGVGTTNITANQLGNQNYNDAATVTRILTVTGPNVPAAPLNLVLERFDLDSNFVVIQWTDNSSNELGFYLRKSSNVGDSLVIIDTLPANTSQRKELNIDLRKQYSYQLNAYNNEGQSLPSNTLSFVLVGLDDLELPQEQVKLFPNPVTDAFSVILKQGVAVPIQLQLLDSQGKLVKPLGKWPANQLSKQVFNISELAAGTYLLEIRVGNKKGYKRIVKL